MEAGADHEQPGEVIQVAAVAAGHVERERQVCATRVGPQVLARRALRGETEIDFRRKPSAGSFT